MKKIIFSILAIISLSVNAQDFSVSAGMNGRNAGLFQIERGATLHKEWQIKVGAGVYWYNLGTHSATYLGVPVTVSKSFTNNKFQPFVDFGNVFMLATDSQQLSDSVNTVNTVLISNTLGIGVKKSVGKYSYLGAKVFVNYQLTPMLSNGSNRNTIGLTLFFGGFLK